VIGDADKTDETVGEIFRPELLQRARDLSLETILRTSKTIQPGMTEAEVKTKLTEIQTELGAPKSWHPPQIRFGVNTLFPFGKPGQENVTLKENDIYFLDIGPLFDEHEGDVGRSFIVGNDPEMKRCCEDVEKIWYEVRNHWKTKGKTGQELYQFAKVRAIMRGWNLSLEKANGHRIADFPHTAKKRGAIETFDKIPMENRWILEIQIRHPEKPFGAFYEDILV
jgi:Xaa-Pro aminopeptidase